MFVSGPGGEEEAVGVGAGGRRGGAVAAPLTGSGRGRPKRVEEAVGVRQVKRAVVMEVVADEPIGDRRLRRGGLQRRDARR